MVCLVFMHGSEECRSTKHITVSVQALSYPKQQCNDFYHLGALVVSAETRVIQHCIAFLMTFFFVTLYRPSG